MNDTPKVYDISVEIIGEVGKTRKDGDLVRHDDGVVPWTAKIGKRLFYSTRARRGLPNR